MKRYFWLFGIVVLAAVLRIYQLGDVPHGVTHDEMGYIYNSYSIAQTGKNIFGERYPFLTYVTRGGFPFMPVTTYLSVLSFRLLPLSAFTGRLPNAILGTISILLVYQLSIVLFKKESIALLSALSLAIMPWHIFFSRTAYDIGIAAFFYLAGMVAFLTEVKHHRYPIVGLLCFVLAMFSYRGMTPVSLPILLLLVWYGTQMTRWSLKRFFAISAGCVVVIGVFACVAFSYKEQGFMSEAGVDIGKVAWEIELMRRDTGGLEQLKQVFINKPMYLFGQWISNYLYVYSVGPLFLHGEGSQIYTMWMRGKLYIVDALFLLIGMYMMSRKRWEKKEAVFVFGFLAIAGLPGAIAGQPYASRTLLMTIPLSLLIAQGIDGIIHLRHVGKFLALGLVGIYLYSGAHFLFDYYLRYAYQRADVWVSDMKEVSRLIDTRPDVSRKAMVTGTSLGDALQYAFYAKLSPEIVQQALNVSHQDKTKPLEVQNVVFAGHCVKTHRLSEMADPLVYSMVFGRPNCFDLEVPTTVIRDFSRNTIWNVYTVK